MQISVIIPSYNRGHCLHRALQSVVQQDSAADQIILVDDGSTDGSCQALENQYPGLEVIHQPNRGVSAARNQGIRAARHDWIALLDSDDCWLPHKLRTLRQAMTEHPGFVLYHSDETWIRDGVRVNPMRKHRKTGGWIFRHCLPLCAISPSTTLLHKPTIIELGLFDETLPACEDYDLWLRLCHRFPVHFVDQALVTRYGGHDDQLSKRHPQMDRFRVRSLSRLLETETLQPEDHSAARETLLGKLDILLKGARKHENFEILDEFEPLQQRWLQKTESLAC